MSQRGGWIAVRSEDPAAVLGRLGLVETGDVDFGGQDYLSLAVLESGWVVVQSCEYDWVAPERLAAASRGAQAIGCQFWDVVMVSQAWGYSDGLAIWSLSHDPDKGRRTLDGAGEIPTVFAAIRARLEQEQAQSGDEPVDYLFDAPMELAEAICGFRSDQPDVPVQTQFKSLERAETGKAAERAARRRAQREGLADRIRTDVYPFVLDLGFRAIAEEPAFHAYYPRGGASAFVRRRGAWSDCLEVRWALDGDTPRIRFNFFVLRGSEPRAGRVGVARSLQRRRKLLQLLLGSRADPAEALERALDEARELLRALDRHLRDGAGDPRIQPAEYWEDRGSGGVPGDS